ncbi:MAG: DUF5682 family protein [Byssovorax sp.]
MIDLRILQRVQVFPVRHHSPRASAVLRAFLDEVDPELVLVEAPEDATGLIDVLVDRETRPPVAVLGYRTDGVQGSSLWPFAAYSPEYVAVAWARKRGREAAFVDVSTGGALASFAGVTGELDIEGECEDRSVHVHAHGDAHEDEDEDGGSGTGDEDERSPEDEGGIRFGFDVHEACARARGFRSFEEFWEASFEAPRYEHEAFRGALLAYAELVRAADRRPLHRARDAFMAKRILARIEERGIAPERVAVVVGAAHAAAFLAGDVDLDFDRVLPAPVPSAVTLIPFSFPRLAEQLGYGAGNRAPQFYQRAHDAGCDYRRAALEVLVEFTEHLRLRGFMASLSDTLEAYRLALMLADIRGKAEPGLDEVREATIATMCRGDATHVDGFLWPSVIGRNIGHVADRIGKNSLQEEFAREIQERRLPATDAVESFVLKLNDPVQVGTSVFLHRLRIAGVSYASFDGRRVGAPRGSPPEEPGGIDALQRISERWEARWTPSTEVALVEKIVLGDTLEQVATRELEERLLGAHATGSAAKVLLEAVVTNSVKTVQSALAVCERLAPDDDDLPSLAEAARVLSDLVSYGSSRSRSLHGDQVISSLCVRTFARAILRLDDACTGSDEGVVPAKEALKTLNSVALTQKKVDRAGWFTAARRVSASYAVNPGAAGLATGLLYLNQVIDDTEIGLLVGQRLSSTHDPEGAAAFLQGFFEVNALALVKSRPVVAALDAYLVGIEKERFRNLLPVLRRTFSGLGATERRYLLENVIGARRIGEKTSAAAEILFEKDRDRLKAMNAELPSLMDDMDDLL